MPQESQKSTPIQQESGQDVRAQLKEMSSKIDDLERKYENVSSSNRTKKLNLKKELNKMRVKYNRLKKTQA